jgi:hypothetical protein
MYRFWLFVFLAAPLASSSQVKLVIETSVSRDKFLGGAVKSSTTQTEAKGVWTLDLRASIEKRLAGSLFFSGGIAFDTKGSNMIYNRDRSDYGNRDIIINYLAVPLGLFVKLPMGHQQVTLGANIYAAWPVRGYERGVQGTLGMGAPYLVAFNRLEFGSANADPTQLLPTVISGSDYGAELSVQIHVNRFRLGLRYMRGFKGVLVNAHLYDRQYYNSGWGFTVGYGF